jgi:plasmid stabilization system protein ParE
VARAHRIAVKITANFEANLDSIEGFWRSSRSPAAFNGLLDEIAKKLIPNLERFPKLGRPFFSRSRHSIETFEKVAQLRRRIGDGELREYVLEQYVVLYVVMQNTVYLSAIKHQRQLSFDLTSFWMGT